MKYELVRNEELNMDVMEAESVTGNKTSKVMTLKEYRLKYGLSNQEAKRQHCQYLQTHGKRGSDNATGMIKDLGLLLKSYRETKQCVNFTFLKPQFAEYKGGRGKRTITPEQMKESLENFTAADKATLLALLSA